MRRPKGIAGAALLASCLVLVAIRVAAHVVFTVPPASPESYAVADADEVGGRAQKVVGPVQESLSALLARASIRSGEKVARVCQACHNLRSEEPGRKLGPNLSGVINRRVASVPSFSYSQAMRIHALKSKKNTWSSEKLFRFIGNPREEVPGTTMMFSGIKDPQKRADLIAYLNTIGSQIPLPAVPQKGRSPGDDETPQLSTEDKEPKEADKS